MKGSNLLVVHRHFQTGVSLDAQCWFATLRRWRMERGRNRSAWQRVAGAPVRRKDEARNALTAAADAAACTADVDRPSILVGRPRGGGADPSDEASLPRILRRPRPVPSSRERLEDVDRIHLAARSV